MYALIVNGTIVDRRSEPEEKGDWRRVVTEGFEPHDGRTHRQTATTTIEPGRVLVRLNVIERELKDVQDELRADVSDIAERIRQAFISPGSGKAISYQEKLAEARLVLDDPQAVDVALVPILAAEATARGVTVEQAATLVHQTYLAFKSVEAPINAVETAAKLAISGASDAASARAAYEGITWQTIP